MHPAVPPAPVKAQKLANIRAMLEAGRDVDTACRVASVPRGTYYRWAAAEAKEGLAGLVDAKPTGRPKKLTLTPAEVHGLRGCSLVAGSMDGGVDLWIRESAKAPAGRDWPEHEAASPATLAALQAIATEARAASRRPSWPGAIREAVRTTANERARLRGGKGLLNVTPSARRSMHWIDENGEQHFVNPGDIWESDDMSVNEPFRYWDAENGRETVGRQTLITGDVFSHAELGATLIGRPRDAYRVVDIAYHLQDIVELYGLPLIWRFEKGVWDNEFIYGVKAPPSWLLPDSFRFGGLEGHLFRVAQKHTSRGKGGIENSFKAFQSFMAHKGTSIGAYRGEFDRAARLYRAALHGVAHGMAAFWTIQEARDGVAAALRDYNARPQQRRAFGGQMTVPAEQYSQAKVRACPASEMWRFCPVKRPITVRGGVVEMRVEHYPLSFRFLVSGSPGCPTLDQGFKLWAAFDPGRPELGCHLFNGEQKGSTLNRQGYSLLDPLGTAAWWQDTAQENFSATARQSYSPQKQASAALRAEFTAAMPTKAGGLITRSTASDVYGRIATNPIQVATPAAAPERETRPAKASANALVDLFTQAG